MFEGFETLQATELHQRETDCEYSSLRNYFVDQICFQCPEHTIAQKFEGLKYCAMQYCEENQYLEPEGFCAECPKYTYPGSRDSNINKECLVDNCTFTQYLTIDGKCKDCDKFTHATEDGLKCMADTCDDTQILLINGTCLTCPDSYTPVAPDLKVCASDVCAAN